MNFELLRNYFQPWENGELFVGFSGGADSTLALLTAHYFQQEFNYKLQAIHINHQLRGEESQQEAANAKIFAEERNIEFKEFKLDLSPGSNLESRAREGRLAIWKRLTQNRPKCAVITGHHSDDRVENLFLRLVRGGNVSSLTGLRAFSEVNKVKFIRPLINFTREEIENNLRTLGINSWACDSSNAHTTYRRNWLRNKGLPELYKEFPAGKKGIRLALNALTVDAQFIENCALEYLQHGNPETLSFWQNMPLALWHRVLRYYRYLKLGEDLVVSPDTIARLQKAVQLRTFEPRTIPLGGFGEMVIQGEHVCLSTPTPPPLLWHWQSNAVTWGNYHFSAKYSPEIPKDLYSALFSAEDLPVELLISAPCPGDKLVPFGRTEPVKLKKLRIDRHIAATPPMPLLRHNETIYWAPGIRHTNQAIWQPSRTPILLQCEPIEQH